MKVKCAILSYNHPDLTARCLQSALKFFTPENILLIHNGSELKNSTNLQSQFPDIQHFLLQKNRHYSGGVNFALNTGFEAADQILFLTNDCELLKFESQTEELFTAPKILKRKTEQIDSLGGFFVSEKGLLGHFKSEQAWQNFTGLKYIPGSAFLMHKKLWQSGVRFEERLETYWEDVLFSQDVQTKGFSLGLCPTIEVRHGIGKTCHKDPYYTSYLYQRNRRWVSSQFNRTDIQKISFWAHYGKDMVKLLLRVARKKDFAKAKLLSKAFLEPNLIKN